MRFWDSSAIVPLILEEASSARIRQTWRADPEMVVWWATGIECLSAVARQERDGALRPLGAQDAFGRLDDLSLAWLEIEPGMRLREIAGRLLRVHPLTAADALQLAGAITAAEERAGSLTFITLDPRLADAARREGFAVEVPGAG